MKILIYCQYLLGMGHLFRAARIASGLEGHDVMLLAGGPPVSLNLPKHVQLVRQQGLRSDASFSSLVPCTPGADLQTIKTTRTAQLLEIMEHFQPHVLLIEQYPFGRGLFRFELVPCLESVRAGRFGKVKVVCSLRDVLSVRNDPAKWESKVIRRMGQYFDAVLVHGDPAVLALDSTFEHINELPAPVYYTGYVAPPRDHLPKADLRKQLGLNVNTPLVIAGFGAGRVGGDLAETVVEAFKKKELAGISLRLFTGPLASETHMARLRAKAAGLPQVQIESYAHNFMSFVAAADAMVAMGGYNTCMDIISAQVPALLCPFEEEPEQSLRCHALAKHYPCEVLLPQDRTPDLLATKLCRAIAGLDSGVSNHVPDINGVKNTARLLKQIVAEETL